MTVGIVVVSHSARLAEGVVEPAGRMAGGKVRIVAAGGALDGTLGTSPDKVRAAIEAADAGQGVLVLLDLGSAVMAAEAALEQLSLDRRRRVAISDAPLVEGAVVAAIESSLGSPLATVAATAEGASTLAKVPGGG